ncbi:unnamed protein product [Owenia fusiformis]|uniref:Carboxylic ester hydrolase n=1 Tax=Owenia fusiformis TaxID=6347 RepID=A0A8J1Y037_OWEFU|nr:unnamed protein product [Owenia fusiformis]
MLFVILLLSQVAATAADAPTVTLPNGPITGSEGSLANLAQYPAFQGRNTTFRAYKGIPFAEPPTGSLRFQPPQPLNSTWSSARNSTMFSKACAQIISPLQFPIPESSVSEDCLYLNVYAPGDGTSTEQKAVMVWIHGGGYAVGGVNAFTEAEMMAVIGDVVIVTINYRLGIFGFFSTGDSVVPGNMGLLDQQFAIRWVKDNINLFGGDPTRITIFGESAGASSVSQQAVSPTNTGLFQRVIAQSGNALSSFAITEVSTETNTAIATQVGCNNTNVTAMVTCLQGVNTTALLDAAKIVTRWAAVIDGVFIIDNPANMLMSTTGPAQDMLKSVDLLHGINSDEGYFSVRGMYPPSETPGFSWSSVQNLHTMYRGVFTQMFGSDPELLEAIWCSYFGSNSVNLTNDDLADIMHELMTDNSFLLPATNFANLHANLGGTPYVYHLTHKPTVKYSFQGETPSWVEGPDHTEDLVYIFPTINTYPQVPSSERTLSYNMITYWSNFAKTGNPNQPSASPELPATWPVYTNDPATTKYLTLKDSSEISSGVIKPDRVQFWGQTVPGMMAGNVAKECINLGLAPGDNDGDGNGTASIIMGHVIYSVTLGLLLSFLLI